MRRARRSSIGLLPVGPADLIASTAHPIEDRIKRGKVVGRTATPFVLAVPRSFVRAGMSKPNISTVEAGKATLLSQIKSAIRTAAAQPMLPRDREARPCNRSAQARRVQLMAARWSSFLAKGDFESIQRPTSWSEPRAPNMRGLPGS